MQASVLKFSTKLYPAWWNHTLTQKEGVSPPTSLLPNIRSSNHATAAPAGTMTRLTEDWSAKTKFSIWSGGWTDSLSAHGLLNPVQHELVKQMRWRQCGTAPPEHSLYSNHIMCRAKPHAEIFAGARTTISHALQLFNNWAFSRRKYHFLTATMTETSAV